MLLETVFSPDTLRCTIEMTWEFIQFEFIKFMTLIYRFFLLFYSCFYSNKRFFLLKNTEWYAKFNVFSYNQSECFCSMCDFTGSINMYFMVKIVFFIWQFHAHLCGHKFFAFERNAHFRGLSLSTEIIHLHKIQLPYVFQLFISIDKRHIHIQ